MNPEKNSRDALSVQDALQLQLEYNRKQYALARITAICAAATLFIVSVTALLLYTNFREIYQSLLISSKNLEHITNELSAADLKQMVLQVNHLVKYSEAGLNDAMVKINAIDIEGLNASIRSLHDAVDPLANFFRGFRR